MSLEEEKTNKPWQEGDPSISLDQIAFVKAIKDIRCVSVNENGEITLMNAARSTNGAIPRITNHTAINHLVNDHMVGEWSNPELIIIMPGESTVDLNGLPQNLAHVDTFWYGDIKIPIDSILLWRDTIPEGFANSRYKNVGLKMINDIEDKAKSLEEIISNPSDIQELNKAEAELNDLRKESHQKFQDIVSSHLLEMNYTPLTRENGRYSHHKNLDECVYNLRLQLGIPTGTIHANTFSGNMEILDYLTEGPLFQIININNNPETQYTIEDVLNNLEEIYRLEDYKNLTQGDKNVEKIFISELYYWMTKNIEKLSDSKGLQEKFSILFNSQEDYRSLLLEYSRDNANLRNLIEQL